MPTLAVTDTSARVKVNGSDSASAARAASSSARLSSARSSHTTTNSSPPSRATVSWRRTVAVRRLPTSTSNSSPVSWPKPVVDDLEAVEVDEQHRHHRVPVAETGERVVQPIDDERAVGQAR